MEEKILKIFEHHKGAHVSGEDMSKALGVSRTSVWKHVEGLRAIGYEIEAVPHLGYKLITRPDRLIPEELRNGLKTRFLGKNILAYRSLDSTNDTAYRLAEDGVKEGTVVVSEEQKRGKGRQGRHWVSPKGGIYLSCVIRPDIEPKEVAKITLAAAVAAAEAIREISSLRAMIKWPNDIIIDGKKVCGILTEMKAEQDKVDFLIVGIGVNVAADIGSLPKGSTSLAAEGGGPYSKVETAKRILEKLERYVLIFKKEGFGGIRDEWHRYSATIGRHIKVRCHDQDIEGEALDVDDDGGLVVRLDNGLQKRLFSGDLVITH